jgi:hypothetical protein
MIILDTHTKDDRADACLALLLAKPRGDSNSLRRLPRQIDGFSGQYDPNIILDCMETYFAGGTEWMSTLVAAVGLVTGS